MKNRKKHFELTRKISSQRWFGKFLLTSLCAVAIACPTGAWGLTWLVGIKKENSDPAILQEALTIYNGQKGGGTWQLDNTGGVITEDTWVFGSRAQCTGQDTATAKMSDNGSLTISNSSSTTAKNIYGGHATADYTASAMDNKLTISDIKVKENIRGGSAVATTGKATANSNFLTINSGVSFVDGSDHSLAGGYSESNSGEAESSSNTLKILDNNFTFSSTNYGVYGGSAASTSATASDNTLEISSGTINSNVYSGEAEGSTSATALNNTLTISGGAFGNDTNSNNSYNIIGGSAEVENFSFDAISNSTVTGIASTNTVTISGNPSFESSISGGSSSAINFSGLYDVSNSTATAFASGNTLTISGNATFESSIYGGSSSAVNTAISQYSGNVSDSTANALASGNTLTISGNATFESSIYGGFSGAGNLFTGDISDSTAAAIASGNTLTIYRGTFKNMVYAGYTNSSSGTTSGTAPASNTSNNTLTIFGGTFGIETYPVNICAGYADSAYGVATATANSNTVTISGGKFTNSNIYGGYGNVDSVSGVATANNNTLTISGGIFGTETYPTNIYGGFAQTDDGTNTEASDNTLIIEGTPNLTYATLYGGETANSSFVHVAGTSTGNTLEIRTSGLTAQNVKYFQNYTFILPSIPQAMNTPVLTVTGGNTNISDSTVSLVLKAGTGTAGTQTVTLLKSTNGDIDMSNITKGTISAEKGIAEEYNFTLDTTSDLTQLVANITQTQIQEVIGPESPLATSLVIDENGKTDNSWGQYSGTSITDHYVFGSKDNQSTGDAVASMSGDGSLTIKGTGDGSPKNVYGLYAVSGSGTATATDATLYIESGTFTKDIYAGYANGNTSAIASGNTVTICGSTFGTSENISEVYAGYAKADYNGTASAINNTMILERGSDGNNPNFENSILYGGYTKIGNTEDAGTSTGNTLKIRTSGLTAQNVKYFQNYTFILPSIPQAMTTPVLTVTGGNTDISNSTVSLVVKVGTGTAGNQTVTLLKSSNGDIDMSNITKGTISAEKGIAEEYTFALDTTSDLTRLVANITQTQIQEVIGPESPLTTSLVIDENGKTDNSWGQYSGTSITDHYVFGSKDNQATGDAVASMSGDGSLTIKGTGDGSPKNVYGAYAVSGSGTATATDAKLSILDGTFEQKVYGGYAYGTDGANVTGNTIDISKGTFKSDMAAGYAYSTDGNATVNENTVTISNGTFESFISAGEAYSESSTATANSNKMTIMGGTFTSGIDAGYAYSKNNNAAANNNSSTISNGTFESYVTAGGVYSGSSTATANGNKITVTGGTFKSDTEAGYSYSENSNATANENTFTICNGTFESFVFGGFAGSTSSTATANSNKMTITGGSFNKEIDAGYAYSQTGNAIAKENTITISGGTFESYVSAGGVNSIYSTATATGNKMTVSGGTFNKEINAGYACSENNNSLVSENAISITNGTFNAFTIGGFAESENHEATASKNSVSIENGTFLAHIIGGYTGPDDDEEEIGDAPSKAIAVNNKVAISGGTFGTETNPVNIYGGFAQTSDGTNTEASDNTVIIEGSPNLTYATLYGGETAKTITETSFEHVDGMSTGNTLKVYTSGLTAQNVKYFQNYVFVLPNTVRNNDVVLTLSGGDNKDKTDISKSTVSVGVKSGSLLYQGNKVILLKNDNGLISTGFTQDKETIKAEQGIALTYEFDVSATNTELVATVTKSGANEKAEAPSEAQTVAPAMLNQAADLLATEGMQSLTAMPAGGIVGTFGVASAGNLRHNSGSHTNVKGVSTLIGVGKRFDPSYGILYTGAFFEYGYGDYSAHNDFSTGYVRGDGHSRYYGGGVMARYDIPCGFYGELSLRFGGSDTYWSSKDLGANYDSNGMYFGTHVALGYLWKFAKDFKLDVYGKYFYAYQEGDKVSILGDTFDFDSVNSNRLRLGARLGYDFCEMLAGYVGAAWEREFSGSANATVYGYDIVAPSLRGNSGIFEGGLSFKPKKDLSFSTDIGITGYVGQKKGVTGFLKLNYSF